MADEQGKSARQKRVRRDGQGGSSIPSADGSADRPTAAERAAAEALLVDLRAAPIEPPILSRKGRPPSVNAVACAMALRLGCEDFGSDAAACRMFGIHAHDVRLREGLRWTWSLECCRGAT